MTPLGAKLRPGQAAWRSCGRRLVGVGLALGLSGLVGLVVGSAPARAAGSHAQIEGDGSSWAANAVNQWVSDVSQQGLQVVFTSTGSAQGRQDYANGSVDFAVSDIGYQGTDPLTGQSDNSSRKYVYLPIVAGGTGFPYQIKVGGQLVRNLRLSGKVLAEIFTNQIKSWDDPQITADNNGRALPAIPIVPVVHSEGSGSTAQFTTYLDTQFPDIWRPFSGANGGAAPGKDFTEYYPVKGAAVAQNGSDNVQNFISAGGSNGAIGYDEYSYALGKNWPVAKIENAGKFFTLPTQYNVAVALTQAQIDPQTLLQTLTNVYSYGDPRTYALSSYSYGIIPTDPVDPKMTTAKRQTLVDYLYYSICGGQKEIGPIGYSSLPLNLVQASFNQINLLKTADPSVDITNRDPTTCNNPTFDPANPSRNLLAEKDPPPAACDQEGQGPCDTNGNGPAYNTGPAGGGSTAGGDTPQQGGGGSSSGPSTGATPGTTASGGNQPGTTKQATVGTGGARVSSRGATTSGSTTNGSTGLAVAGPATPTQAAKTNLADGPPELVPFRWVGSSRLLVPLSVVLLLIVVAGPAVVVLLLARRRRTAEA